MSRSFIYLDHNASSPMGTQVIEAMTRAIATLEGNASSVHSAGRLVHDAIEAARAHVATLAGATPQEVVFTSGGTEANNLAVHGLRPARIVHSTTEHDSVLAPVRQMALQGVSVAPLAVDKHGVVDLQALREILAEGPRPTLVSIHHANNETGVLQPVAEAAAIAHAHGAYVHCDAAQTAGRLKARFSGLDADLLTLSAHKIGGPQGVGALIVRDGLAIAPDIRGGGQERRRRAGTENAIGIVGFGEAARLALQSHEDWRPIEALRDEMERRLRAVDPELEVFGSEAARLPNTSNVVMPGVSSETQVMAFDLAGICVSAGAACSSGKAGRSNVLSAMGVSDEIAGSAIRISLGLDTTAWDIGRLVEAWLDIRARCLGAVDGAMATANG